MLLRVLFHGRSLQLHAAPGWAVGLGQYQSDVMATSVQSGQRVLRKDRRAGKDQAHGLALEFALRFDQFAANAGAFEQGQVFDKHLAHEVVHFVLNAHRHQAIGFVGLHLPMLI